MQTKSGIIVDVYERDRTVHKVEKGGDYSGQVLNEYGLDALEENGKHLLTFVVNTPPLTSPICLSTRMGEISHTLAVIGSPNMFTCSQNKSCPYK